MTDLEISTPPYEFIFCKEVCCPAITTHAFTHAKKHVLAISVERATPKWGKPSSSLERWLAA